jgi:hypothetical protein
MSSVYQLCYAVSSCVSQPQTKACHQMALDGPDGLERALFILQGPEVSVQTDVGQTEQTSECENQRRRWK